jgi:hypothetical protein
MRQPMTRASFGLSWISKRFLVVGLEDPTA